MSSTKKPDDHGWTTTADLKTQVLKWWQSGELLSELAADTSSFPRRLKFKAPTSPEISERFDAVRKWILSISDAKDDKTHFRLEMRQVKHKVFGRNSLPAEAWVDSIEDALFLIGKKKEAAKYMQIYSMTSVRLPQLTSWVKQRPLRALEFHEDWDRLLSVLSWFESNPRPKIHLRQIDISGIHSKFIESHREILIELLDIILPPDAVQTEIVGTKNFAERYYLLDKPVRVRFRFLDEKLATVLNLPYFEGQDITLDSETFSDLRPAVKRVFITENEINFLSFPELPDSMVIFGSGYGLGAILQANWLMHCQVFYWGDIDTHGFAILSEARGALPHLRSLLMDEATFVLHLDRASTDTQHKALQLPRLTDEEQSLYQQLKANYWGVSVRIEQELISWNYASEIIRKSISKGKSLKAPSMSNRTYMQLLNALDLKEENIRDHSPATRLDANDLSNYLTPSKCGLRIYLDHKGQTEKRPSAATRLRRDLGQKHTRFLLTQLVKRLPPDAKVLDLRELTEGERLIATRNGIKNRAALIINPSFEIETSLAGFDCVIHATPHTLIWQNGTYTIRHMTTAKRVSLNEHPEVFLQLQLFGWMFATVYGEEAVLEAQSDSHEVMRFAADGGRASLKALHKILELKTLQNQPYSPVGTTKCEACHYKNHCWSAAENGRDVSTLVGVDQNLALSLHKAGVRTIDALYADFNEHQLAAFETTSGSSAQLQRVGNKALSILKMAEAKIKGEAIILQAPALPSSETFVVIDFEGLPTLGEDDDCVYLWGARIYGSDADCIDYQPNVYDMGEEARAGKEERKAGDELGGECMAWKAFLAFCQSVFDKLGDAPFVHWHHYERIKITAYIERYGDSDGIGARVLENLVDLHRIVRDAVALPISSYSLKSVEKFIGFERSQSDYGGAWSVEKYRRAVGDPDPESRSRCVEEIRLYNMEDLQATWRIITWLKEFGRIKNVFHPAERSDQ